MRIEIIVSLVILFTLIIGGALAIYGLWSEKTRYVILSLILLIALVCFMVALIALAYKYQQ